MERENYYLLLGLSVDPPEQDPKVISEALKKKQAEWSRSRNHPTKAIQAKRYIGMIPDMRKVFSDSKLRKQEADAARQHIRRSQAEQFERIDQHLRLLMNKGAVTDKEIAGVAAIDGLFEDLVRERLKKNEILFKIDLEIEKQLAGGKVSEKKLKTLAKKLSVGPDKLREQVRKKEEIRLQDIRNYLAVACQKGYITEDAIANLSKVYGVKEGLILSHLECPIRKQAGPKGLQPKPMDTTLVHTIEDNLKIVGKDTLYEFLDLPKDAPLSILQEISKEKEMEIRKVSKKDAETTASGALAGHCIVIFRSPRSRAAYDFTRRLTRVGEFNTDIDVAGIEKKIKEPLFRPLVQRAIAIGMSVEEGIDYLREYCREKGYKLEEPIKRFSLSRDKIVINEKWTLGLNPKQPSFWIVVAAVLLLVSLIAVGGMFSMNMYRAAQLKGAYNTMLSDVQTRPGLEAKERVLQNFLNRYGHTEYAESARKELARVRQGMEEQDYKKTLSDAEAFNAEDNYEETAKIYDWYLKRYPKGAHTARIREQAEKIPELIDDRDYEKAVEAASRGDFTQSIRAYNAYLKQHPEGKHIEDVRRQIMEMVEHYFSALKQELAGCESREEWAECIRLTHEFAARFAGTEQAREAEGLKIRYQKTLQHEKDLATLAKESDIRLMQYDFESAKGIYQAYLEANPEAPSYMRKRIAGQVSAIEQKKGQYEKEEQEWENVLSFANDRLAGLDERVDRLERYLAGNPGASRHQEEAQKILVELRAEKKLQDARMEAQSEQQEWAAVMAYSRNGSVDINDRIARVERFVAQKPSEKFLQGAQTLLSRLRQEKQSIDERIRAQQERQARVNREIARIRSLVSQIGRYTENGNGTVTDRKSGLMWATVDSYVDLGQCIDFSQAEAYVRSLNTGGYGNWRLPGVNELAGIYKTQPFFPGAQAQWYWSSDLIWHGWNKKGYIVTTKQETAWSKLQVELEKCGAVRAVRSP